MAFPLALLRLLAAGNGVSGEALGEQLGISRAAIWKQISSLRELGIEVDAVAGEGYRLPQALELLDVADKKPSFPAYPHLTVHYFPVLNSTNEYLREQIEQQGLEQPQLALAEYQSAGRGRRGRTWQAGFAQSLLMSLAMRMPCSAVQLGGLSLACGVAVAQALESLGVAGLQLKWPNDILLDGAKLGGILIELTGEAEGPCDVIVGIGLNIHAVPNADKLDQAVASMPAQSRNDVLQAVVEQLMGVLESYTEQGFAPWRELWQRRNAHAEQLIRILSEHAPEQHGECAGVDEQGALLLKTAQGIQPIYAGNVSLRPS